MSFVRGKYNCFDFCQNLLAPSHYQNTSKNWLGSFMGVLVKIPVHHHEK